jgi:inosine-uridine nucleoside N-ribohydrolase
MGKLLILVCLMTSVCFAAHPVIFDTDMGNDVDDALALAMLHTLSDRGECQLIGVTLTNANLSALAYIRMIDRFYGRDDLPVGAAALRIMQYTGGGAFDSAPDLLRRLLQNATEKVVIVQTGFSTNLAAMLNSPDDIALVREKVALVVAMAGNFADGAAEYNVKIDVASAKAVFERWPTPIVFSGFEIGRELPFPATAIERDFTYASPHPIAESYRAYMKMPYDRPTWDLTAVLEAVRPDVYFSHSDNGTVTVDEKGITHFDAGDGNRQYLRLDPARRAEILSVLELLSSEPPVRH